MGNNIKYELRCCNIDSDECCHPHIFQIIEINDLKRTHIEYFRVFSDLSGVSSLPHKWWKIQNLQIVAKVINENADLIPKLIKQFNRKNKKGVLVNSTPGESYFLNKLTIKGVSDSKQI